MVSQFSNISFTKMYKIVIVILALVAVASARLRACDRGVLGPFPQGVRISGCANDQVCRLIRNRDVVGELDFISSECDAK